MAANVVSFREHSEGEDNFSDWIDLSLYMGKKVQETVISKAMLEPCDSLFLSPSFHLHCLFSS